MVGCKFVSSVVPQLLPHQKITAKVLLLRSSVPGYFKVSPWFTRTVAAVVSYVVGGDDDDA